MKRMFEALFLVFFILIFMSFMFLTMMWVDLNAKYEVMTKDLVETKTELFKYRQETETFEDIIVNRRWE